MANRGMNPNTLQYLMGNANITMTLGYYAHGTFQSATAELEKMCIRDRYYPTVQSDLLLRQPFVS